MSEPSSKPVSMGLQLFPPPPRKAKPVRKPSTRKRSSSSQEWPESAIQRSRSPSFPSETPQSARDGTQSALGGRQTPQAGRASPIAIAVPSYNGPDISQQSVGERQAPQTGRASPITIPGPLYAGAEIPRSHTSFSEAPTLVRSNSNSSHSSTAKRGLHNSPQRGEEPVIRSIFPRYDPQLPLEHQNYYPTQASPTHIPRQVINRRPYSPSFHDDRSPLSSPMAMGTSPGRFPRGISIEEPPMEISTADEVKELWKVVNGWRVSNSEGRTFCLKLTSSAEEPVHTLSSASQAFYTLRVEPTSTSAQMTMTRQDPNKPLKENKTGTSSKPNTGAEVMSTTLEEAVRRLPPNDGLVALLYPRAASDMVIDVMNKSPQRADAPNIIAAAERECGRLVWDEDSNKNYLVHPALVTPFIINISSSPAWSRVEYTLEHSEMPRNLVRLVRDGAGGGFLEVDTGVASKIDCFYIVDVAICAILLVAAADAKDRHVEIFEAPPSLAPQSPKSPSSFASKSMRMGSRLKGKKGTKPMKDKDVKFEEFEMDLESQDSVKGKEKDSKKDEKIPGFFGLIWMLVKFFVWTITMVFKGLGKCIVWGCRCGTRSKK